MFKKLATGATAALLLGLAVYGAFLWVENLRRDAGDRALAKTATWSTLAQGQARMMVEEYGPPQWSSHEKLEWTGPWPWRSIVVTDEAAPLEQTVPYKVPEDKLVELASFSHGLKAFAGADELTARGVSEAANRLCLNLANDIATGKRTAAQADALYRQVVELSIAGKTSSYTQRLLFAVPPPREDQLPLP